ncbi:MAG TPA: type II secretion system F family protein [Parachlamydiaceae bacterium]|nr:type II secretion system F family protein [Parachlamydiaceae bacterium]
MPIFKKNSSTKKKLADYTELVPQVKKSLISSILHDLLVTPTLMTSLTYINIFIFYIFFVLVLSGHELNIWYGLVYIPIILLSNYMRKSKKEKERVEIAHSIPFFAEALANALSVGGSLEDAIRQASMHLKGRIRIEINEMLLKHALGKNIDVLLKELDVKFPNTGLIYLIFLLNSYEQLGVGISPLLKKISTTLKQREKDEDKIHTILAGGSTYAWLTIVIFLMIFAALGFLLQDQLKYLLSPELKFIFIFLLIWAFVGIVVVTRFTSLEYARTVSNKPNLKKFFSKRKFDKNEILKYSEADLHFWKMKIFLYAPLIIAFLISFMTSYYSDDFFTILISFSVGYLVIKFLSIYILSGIVDDQLIKTIETFPEILQIFTIGLYTGLNNHLSFEFALNAVKGNTPKILEEELCRTQQAMECGEEQLNTWKRLARRLPFESITDFAEIMAMAPLHGESITQSVVDITNAYHEKKMLSVEKTANKASQLVIPIIIVAFFPLFIFFVFAPMITKIVTLIST